ncbi:MAG: chromosomal replication initiator protein DnaA [Anaerolineae bacterium]|nr:chromosomal replication initiator protein DnaA [Anaerolineae bacterium]MDW8097906.1 chromosomal replication initiator protein DnaA [Anaerolineae bacterium]
MNHLAGTPRAEAIWRATLGELQLRMPRATYDTWLKNSTLLAYEDGCFIIGVPNAYAKDWLEQRLHGLVKRVLESVAGHAVELRFTVRPPAERRTSMTDAVPLLLKETAFPVETKPSSSSNGRHLLNPRYTFEAFIVGDNNRLAHAAALSVTDYPGQKFNPLLIYGGTGLGKTHLLHAIGHRSLSRGIRVLYVTSEEFTIELINAIRTQTTEAFRNKYRTSDILLIDDIQFIAGKESTQEEFFHTFNTLHAANRQIVLTSDRHPLAMTTLEERLRSRFGGGLCVDIKPPDLEVRAAIVKAKAAAIGFHLPDDVVMLIAQRVRTNIRDLEGALNRVVAEAQMYNSPITLQQAQAVLETLAPPQVALSPEETVKLVARHLGVDEDELLGRGRSKEVAMARQILMYLLRHVCDLSLPQIGELLGRDHTTVIYGIEKVERLIETDDHVRRSIMRLREELFATAR